MIVTLSFALLLSAIVLLSFELGSRRATATWKSIVKTSQTLESLTAAVQRMTETVEAMRKVADENDVTLGKAVTTMQKLHAQLSTDPDARTGRGQRMDGSASSGPPVRLDLPT